MRLLLDTHVFLWMALASDRMPDAIKSAIRSPANEVWLSAISVWEIAIKQGRGRLALPSPAVEFVTGHRQGHGIASLPVEETAAAHLARLPLIHADPFDRILVCQAIEHDLTIVTSDAQVQRYPVKTLWTPNYQTKGPGSLPALRIVSPPSRNALRRDKPPSPQLGAA